MNEYKEEGNIGKGGNLGKCGDGKSMRNCH